MKIKNVLGLAAIILGLTGCVNLQHKDNVTSSSLVEFLYPDSTNYVEHKPEIPVLTLPLNVGIAFVPSSQSSSLEPSAKKKYDILSDVKRKFVELDYVNRIEIISDNYLKKGGGFDTLEQISRLHNVDVIALVSYDQVTQNNQNHASLLYWTIAGMYLIPGNDNTTQTFIDTAVFDVKSNKLLFRAPGVSKVEAISTAVGLDETIIDNSNEGFDLAVTDMITNLNTELDLFKVRVKEEKIAKVEYSSGYSGGSVSWLVISALMMICLVRMKERTRSRVTA
ncbi:rhombotarget lipoprotein [Vibrio kasasachensis]|uniref:rhombotarget lipoprotein n=1 Tax=Vibrio kasasachensis TaxID=2910248 RepID=UPI003D0A8657